MSKNSLLLHTCCAPCLVYVHKKLNELGSGFDSYFYNPNIHPVMEHRKRLETLTGYCERFSIDLIKNEEFLQERWECKGYECLDCYRLRMEETARYAKEHGYNAFSTTLLVSIYQKHEIIKQVCNDMAEKYGIEFFYYDFREGFREGQNMAKELGLYRQKYCGCINSYNSSVFKDKITWTEENR